MFVVDGRASAMLVFGVDGQGQCKCLEWMVKGNVSV